MKQFRRGLVASLVLIASSPVPALAALRNWSGLWESPDLRPAASGSFSTPVADIIRNFGSLPPYTPTENANFQAHVKAFEGEFYSDRNPLKPLCIFGFPVNMLFPV
jgi:hypothetical protein